MGSTVENLDLFVFMFFILGGIFGSFANVIIIRLPLKKSIAYPRSHCVTCGHTIAWYDNVPLLSYLFLRGRCRHCQSQFSLRYLIVELITAWLFALSYEYFGFSWNLVEALCFLFPIVICTFIDIEHMILPDKFTLSGVVIGLVGSLLNPDRQFYEAIIGVLLGGGFLWLLAYLYFVFSGRAGLGGGDIKLLAWIGAVLGWRAIPFVILISSIFGSTVGIILSKRNPEGLKTMIPFGPFLAIGAVIYLFGGSWLGEIYLNLFLPGL